MLFLNTIPLWVSGLLVLVLTLLATSAPTFIRRRIGLDRLRVNNEVAGFKFATVGVLYAVLLAFAVIVVWEKFAEADRTVAKEAGTIATLYRLAGGLEEEPRTAFRSNLTDYTNKAIVEDWPDMEHGKYSRHVTDALNQAYSTVLSLHPSDQRGAVVLTELLGQLNLLRLSSSRAALVEESHRRCFGTFYFAVGDLSRQSRHVTQRL